MSWVVIFAEALTASTVRSRLTAISQVQRLPGWFKQRDNYFYPAWAYVYPTTVLRMPYSLLVAVLWSCIVYYPVGLAPEASRCAHFNSRLCFAGLDRFAS